MPIDLKTVTLEPLRPAYDHLVARFGNKEASRYQEASYDIQPVENLHYIPTWDPEQALYDPELSRVRMADWYAIKDPRQLYYGSYTALRSRQRDTAEANFGFVESRGLAELMPEELRQQALALLVPLRHAAWGANLNDTLASGYGYGTTFTQPLLMTAMDQLGIAQYLSRLGLLLGGPEALEAGKQAWMESPDWQPLRRFTEDSMVVRDPVEVFTVQNLMMDGLLLPLVYDHLVDDVLASRGAACVAMLTQFMTDWGKETRRWVDAVVKAIAAESEGNRVVLREWIAQWQPRAAEALIPLARIVLGDDAEAAVEEQLAALAKRIEKAGVNAEQATA